MQSCRTDREEEKRAAKDQAPTEVEVTPIAAQNASTMTLLVHILKQQFSFIFYVYILLIMESFHAKLVDKFLVVLVPPYMHDRNAFIFCDYRSVVHFNHVSAYRCINDSNDTLRVTSECYCIEHQ